MNKFGGFFLPIFVFYFIANFVCSYKFSDLTEDIDNADTCNLNIESDNSVYGRKIGDPSNICWKTAGLQPFLCPPREKGTNETNYDCPIVENGFEVIAVCTNTRIQSPLELNLPENITALCLGNSNIFRMEKGSFLRYKNLTFLNLSNLSISDSIDPLAFEGLRSLTSLSFSGNLKQVSNKTFEPLVNLKMLNLSHWIAENTTVENVMEHLEFDSLQSLSETIEILDMSHVNEESINGVFWELRQPLFSTLNRTKLKCLSLTHNQITTIREGILDKFPYLEQFWLASNVLMGGDSKTSTDFSKMSNLYFLDISYQNYVNWAYRISKNKIVNCGSKIFSHQYVDHALEYEESYGQDPSEKEQNDHRSLEIENTSTNCLRLPKRLQKVNIGYFRFATVYHYAHVCQGEELKNLAVINAPYLFVSFLLRKISDIYPNLRRLNLCGSKILILKTSFFAGLYELEYLNLENFNLNWFFPSQSNQEKWKNLTADSNFTKLTYLNLASNNLCYLDSKFLNKIESLEKLILRDNKLTVLPINVSKLENLTYVDISYNRITEISKNLKQVLSNHERYGERKTNLTVDLTGNDIFCSCSDIPHIKKIQTADVKRYLHFDGFKCKFISRQSYDVYKININGMRELCGSWKGWIIYWIYIMFLLMFFIICVFYKFHHSILFRLYLIKFLCKKICLSRKYYEEQIQYEYDAFLCCHTDDIVQLKSLYEELEDEYGYRLFIMERDGLACRTTIDAIKETFVQCHHVILVISQKMLKNTLLKYILYLAKNRHDNQEGNVIFIILGDTNEIKNEKLPNTLVYLYSTSPCFTWKNKREKGQKLWTEIRKLLGSPIYK